MTYVRTMLLPSDSGRAYVLFLCAIGIVGFLFGSMCMLHLDLLCGRLVQKGEPRRCLSRRQAMCINSLIEESLAQKRHKEELNKRDANDQLEKGNYYNLNHDEKGAQGPQVQGYKDEQLQQGILGQGVDVQGYENGDDGSEVEKNQLKDEWFENANGDENQDRGQQEKVYEQEKILDLEQKLKYGPENLDQDFDFTATTLEWNDFSDDVIDYDGDTNEQWCDEQTVEILKELLYELVED